MADVQVSRNDELGRFEAHVDGRRAGFTEFRKVGGTYVFPHTEVDDEFSGEGVGTDLVRGALDAMRTEGATINPVCPFVKKVAEENPEYHELLAR